jgi:hypothetical protein
MLRILSFGWFTYFLRSNFTVFLKSLPFVGSATTFRPVGWLGPFIFTSVVQLLIYLPLLLIIGIYINVQIFQPGFLVVTGFGIIFGTIFRSIINTSLTYLEYDGFKLKFEVFGLYEKTEESISSENLEGITHFESIVTGTHNYKICFLTKDGRLLLAHVTPWKYIFKKRLKKIVDSVQLPIVEYPGGEPINDMNIGRSNI